MMSSSSEYDWSEGLRKALPEVEDKLNVPSIITTLQSMDLLDAYEYQDVNSEPKSIEKTRKVFNNIRGKGAKLQQLFVTLLESKPGTKHIAEVIKQYARKPSSTDHEKPEKRITGEESVDSGETVSSVPVYSFPKKELPNRDEEKLFEGSTLMPVYKWHEYENAVVFVQEEQGVFTAFFLDDGKGNVFFATCFHNLCHEGDDRSKLTEEDFIVRLKECSWYPFQITSDVKDHLEMQFKGEDILQASGGPDSSRPLMHRDHDLVLFPTHLSNLNKEIKRKLQATLSDSKAAAFVIEQYYQLRALSLKPFFEVMKDKSCKKSLHGIILGHPDGGVLVRTERTMKMSLQKKKSEFDHVISTEEGSSGSPIFCVYVQEPVLCGIHCGYDKGTNKNYAYYLEESLFVRCAMDEDGPY